MILQRTMIYIIRNRMLIIRYIQTAILANNRLLYRIVGNFQEAHNSRSVLNRHAHHIDLYTIYS